MFMKKVKCLMLLFMICLLMVTGCGKNKDNGNGTTTTTTTTAKVVKPDVFYTFESGTEETPEKKYQNYQDIIKEYSINVFIRHTVFEGKDTMALCMFRNEKLECVDIDFSNNEKIISDIKGYLGLESCLIEDLSPWCEDDNFYFNRFEEGINLGDKNAKGACAIYENGEYLCSV